MNDNIDLRNPHYRVDSDLVRKNIVSDFRGDNSKPTIYVEGESDQKFMNRFNDPKNPELVFKQPNISFSGIGNKDWIINHIKKKGNKKICGIIDKDFDDPQSIQSYVNNDYIFITDKHDLETTMFFSDKKLFNNIVDDFLTKIGLNDILKEINKTNEKAEFERAIYIAYQIGIIKSVFPKDFDFKKNSINNVLDSDKIILDDYYSCFNVPSLLYGLCQKKGNYIEERTSCNDEMRLEEINVAINGLEKSIEIFKKVQCFKDLIKLPNIISNFRPGPNGKYSFVRSQKAILKSKNLWDIVNGHDVCEILLNLSKNLAKFVNFRRKEFEDEMVYRYKMDLFFDTSLYSSMKSIGLIFKLNKR